MEEPIYDPASRSPSFEVFDKYKLHNIPDKTSLRLKVTFAPSAAASPHTHHGAFIAAHVPTGSVLNKLNDDWMAPEMAGQRSFYEAPGCGHRISTNASETEEASILATFILETEKMDSIIEQEEPISEQLF